MNTAKNDVYTIITKQILDLLVKGVVPWHKPWKSGLYGMHRNIVTKKDYRGINPWLLTCVAESAGYVSPYWLTYKQAKDLGGNVRQGEKSTIVVFWKWLEIETKDDDSQGNKIKKNIPFLRYYRVFNLEQCENLDENKIPSDGIPKPEDLPEFESISVCESIVENMQNRPKIEHSAEPRCYYRQIDDLVHMPNKNLFESPETYYSAIFHELAHSTGHETRLDRKKQKIAAFGSEEYSKEELIAEMASAMLCGVTNISPKVIENQAAYIDNWRKAISSDKKLVVTAASAAHKAADYIQNK